MVSNNGRKLNEDEITRLIDFWLNTPSHLMWSRMTKEWLRWFILGIVVTPEGVSKFITESTPPPTTHPFRSYL
jgi:hypothetical protein